jgi:TRAP-type C4-dicarboxylate transport system substrate-binding protein
MKKVSPIVFAATVLFLTFSLLSAFTPQNAVAKTYRWRMQSVWATKLTQRYLETFAKNVKKATDGQMNIKVYQANQLVKIKATREAVQTGAIEMACEAGPYVGRVIPEANVEFGLPFSYRSWPEAWELWTEYGLREKIQEAYVEKGLYNLTIQPAGEYALMTTKPINKLEDLKGMKIRTWGPTAQILKKLGASPTMVPGAEQYMALKRGTVDGTVYPIHVLDSYKLKEVLRFVIRPSVINPPTTEIYINLKMWNDLPADLKKKIIEASSLHLADWQADSVKDGEIAVENLKKLGGKELTLPDSEVRKLRKVAFEVWDELGKKTPRTKECVEIVKKFMKDKGLGVD